MSTSNALKMYGLGLQKAVWCGFGEPMQKNLDMILLQFLQYTRYLSFGNMCVTWTQSFYLSIALALVLDFHIQFVFFLPARKWTITIRVPALSCNCSFPNVELRQKVAPVHSPSIQIHASPKTMIISRGVSNAGLANHQ